MHETDADRPDEGDPLAQIVRAAGRREAPPAAHYEQVFAATHAVWVRRMRQRRQRRWFAAAAATALLTTGAVFILAWLNQATAPIGEMIAMHGTVERFDADSDRWLAVDVGADTRGENRSVTEALEAGTRLRTRADSGIALAMTTGGSLRVHADTLLTLDRAGVELTTGTVYFDSADRPKDQPIEILTALGRVRDVGTQFEVHLGAGNLRVRVRSGEIAVLESPVPGAVAGQAGDEVELSSAGEITRRDIAPDDTRWSWTQALAVAPQFATPTVHAYLVWIASETGRQLRFASETVRLQAELARFIGDPAGLTPTQLLVTIAATSNFSYEITGDGTIMVGRNE